LSSTDHNLSIYSSNSGRDWKVVDQSLAASIDETDATPTIVITDSLSSTNNLRFEAMQHTPLFVSFTRDQDTVISNIARFPHVYDRLEISGQWTFDGIGQPYPSRRLGTGNSLGWPGQQALVILIDQEVDVQDIRTLLKDTICSDLNLM
jgi:hypothetical protein